MKAELHPEVKPTIFSCACGETFTNDSIIGGEVKVDICSKCHPFFTGKAKLVDTAGRIDKFNRRYGRTSS